MLAFFIWVCLLVLGRKVMGLWVFFYVYGGRDREEGGVRWKAMVGFGKAASCLFYVNNVASGFKT